MSYWSTFYNFHKLFLYFWGIFYNLFVFWLFVFWSIIFFIKAQISDFSNFLLAFKGSWMMGKDSLFLGKACITKRAKQGP